MMRRILFAALVPGLAGGCAGYSGRGLEPGLATEDDVEAVMGEPYEVRAAPGGETVLWYPRWRYGRENYAARIAPDGKLIGIEQRLTEENIARLVRGRTVSDDVVELLGPPHRSDPYPRMDRQVWTYYMQGSPYWKVLYVQFSRADQVVREVYYMDDPEARPPSRGRR